MDWPSTSEGIAITTNAQIIASPKKLPSAARAMALARLNEGSAVALPESISPLGESAVAIVEPVAVARDGDRSCCFARWRADADCEPPVRKRSTRDGLRLRDWRCHDRAGSGRNSGFVTSVRGGGNG